MPGKQKEFLTRAEKIAFDKDHRQRIRFNMSKYDTAVAKGKEQYYNLDLAKDRIASIKKKAIYNLDQYLVQFEENFTKTGGTVFWAQNSNQAVNYILDLAKKNSVKTLVKSKSMITEEVELNKHLESAGIESVETDLGEFIVQVAEEKPYHIVTPAMHKSKQDVADLFHRKFQTSKDASAEDLTLFVRDRLRNIFRNADMGVTGANFIVANVGGIALTENEGNAFLSVSFPKIHVVIAGIEKIVPSVKDMGFIWPVLASHGTGQKITSYNSLIRGPKKDNEQDGPEEMHVILLDNGRTDLIKDEELIDSLTCIRCGACLNACPVYRNIGGYTYDATYSGPIGSVISPHYKGFADYNHLSFASSLCGRCSEVCPAKIDLHNMLLVNRRKAVEQGLTKREEKMVMKNWAKLMTSRSLLNFGSNFKNLGLKTFAKKAWGPRREFPAFPSKSFNKIWKRGK
ncbi:MAG: iron-sulfur cluster-binding protein [Marinilabiliales bacterium]|nr:MAG: iron-sulfur cluster-binding protein [Marinilabiliales bacterium]